MNRLSIVTPWLNHPELVPSYEAAMQGAEVIVVDNGSDPDTAEALDRMAERLGNGSRVVHNPENRYFTAANNQGYALSTGDVVAFVNNDVEGAGWLAAVERDVAEGGLYGPSVEVHSVDGEQYPYVEGWCVAAGRSAWQALETGAGPWDQVNYVRCYAEDLDLSFRARRAGLSLYCCQWPLRHIGNYTSRHTGGADDFADQNRATFADQVRAWRAAQP